MAQNIVISTDLLKDASREMVVPADTVDAALATFGRRLAELGKPWGDDEIGEKWAKEYEPGLELFLEAMGSITDGLRTLSKDVNTMAVQYELTELSNLQ